MIGLTRQLIGKHFKLIPDEKESELQFERLMGALLESDKKKQMEAFKEKHQSRVGPETMQDLLDGVTFDGNEGVKMKFVDGIGTYNIVLKKLFPGADVVRITPKDWYRTQVRHWMWNIDKGTQALTSRISDLHLPHNCIQGWELHLQAGRCQILRYQERERGDDHRGIRLRMLI